MDMLAYKSAILIGGLAMFFIAERLFPFARMVRGISRIAKNLSVAGINAILSPLLVVPVTATVVGFAHDWRPADWTGWTSIILDLVVLDCWIYIWHRANHRLPFLWRFHEVHHLDETLDSTSAFRFHFGEVLLSAILRCLVIVALAVPLKTVVLFEVILALATIFHHSNVSLPPRLEKLLSLAIVTPSIHWVHHHAIRADTDSNYATILSIWDRIFASTSRTLRTPDMPIGVEAKSDLPLVGLLKKPFWRG
jgi:sterol desaturase/sphingolipid hydroxylase (fatty acid hydroxylase superfamily)